MFDTSIFISFNDNVRKATIRNLLKLCIKNYKYIYIIKNDNIKNKLDNIVLKDVYNFKEQISNNQDHDNRNTIIMIDKINPKIHIYSHRVGINENVESFNIEKNYNVHVDYTNLKGIIKLSDMQSILIKTKVFLNNVTPFDYEKSVIVFDLDDTLVAKDGCIMFKNMSKIIHSLRDCFDLIVLWSHGNNRHVTNNLLVKLKDIKFDSVIVLDKNAILDGEYYAHNKGVGKLFNVINREHGVGKLKLTALVDDQAGNFIGDYDLFSHIPNSYNDDGKQIINLLQETKEMAYKILLKTKKPERLKFNLNN